MYIIHCYNTYLNSISVFYSDLGAVYLSAYLSADTPATNSSRQRSQTKTIFPQQLPHSYPSHKLPRCLFGGASQYSSFRRCSNPHACQVEGAQMMGTSGQPVDDVALYSNLTDPLDILQLSLQVLFLWYGNVLYVYRI